MMEDLTCPKCGFETPYQETLSNHNCVKPSDLAYKTACGWADGETTTIRLAVDIQKALNQENKTLRDVIKNFLGILDTPLGRMKFQSQFVKDVIEEAKKV